MRRDEALCTQGGIEAGVLPLLGKTYLMEGPAEVNSEASSLSHS